MYFDVHQGYHWLTDRRVQASQAAPGSAPRHVEEDPGLRGGALAVPRQHVACGVGLEEVDEAWEELPAVSGILVGETGESPSLFCEQSERFYGF